MTNSSASTSRPSPDRRPQSVLVVDDEETIRDLMVLMLKFEGYKVYSAETPAKALAMAESWQREPIDLLITDLSMAGMNGDALAGELASHFPELRVIITSGYSANDPMVVGLKLRNWIYVPKPANGPTLTKAIAALFEESPTHA